MTSTYKNLKDLWLEYTTYVKSEIGEIPFCGLCGNAGKVDTRISATTPSGVKCGAVFYCICPNGRARKKANTKQKYGGSSIL